MQLSANGTQRATMSDVIAYHIKDAVKASGSTRTNIFNAIREGKLPARKDGRRTIIMADDLRNWVSSLPMRRAA